MMRCRRTAGAVLATFAFAVLALSAGPAVAKTSSGHPPHHSSLSASTAPPHDGPGKDAPAKNAPAKGTPVNGAPVGGTPVAGTPVNGTPVNGAPVSGTPVKATTVKAALVEAAHQALAPAAKAAPVNGATVKAAASVVVKSSSVRRALTLSHGGGASALAEGSPAEGSTSGASTSGATSTAGAAPAPNPGAFGTTINPALVSSGADDLRTSALVLLLVLLVLGFLALYPRFDRGDPKLAAEAVDEDDYSEFR